jgi:hypothetical protein
MCRDVSGCVGMCRDVSGCVGMCRDVSQCVGSDEIYLFDLRHVKLEYAGLSYQMNPQFLLRDSSLSIGSL